MHGITLRARRGFTLIEIIVTLALVGLIVGLMVVNVGAIMQGLGPRPLPDILHKAVREARYQAAAGKQTVVMRFDPESASFRIADENGKELAEIDTHYEPDSREVEIQFEQILPSRGLTGLSREEHLPIETVRFRPDRSSTPFLARLVYEGTRSVHYYDPFSDLELAREE